MNSAERLRNRLRDKHSGRSPKRGRIGDINKCLRIAGAVDIYRMNDAAYRLLMTALDGRPFAGSLAWRPARFIRACSRILRQPLANF
jgi:hypothetical protein